jgi:two-component system NtrC family sensor kinase
VLRRLLLPIQTSLRNKLLVLVLFPVLLVMPITLGLAIYWSKAFSYEQLLMKVRTDLAVAHDVFTQLQRDYLGRLGNLAQSYRFRKGFEAGEWRSVRTQIDALRYTGRFDFLHLTDRNGRWLGQPEAGTSKYSMLGSRALRGEPAVGVEVFSSADLQREDQALAQRVRLRLVHTPRALPAQRAVEDRAMVVRAMYPIQDAQGKVVALLDGGVLLNGNFRFVDAIRDLVYGPGSLPEGSWGTVTVFLDDVRISTNVPLKRGERALGTRVSQEVRDKVLQHGAVWVDRAFVVNGWYVSAYEPIRDVEGQRVGMLDAGFLEAAFRSAVFQALGVLIVMFVAVMALSAVVAIRGARSIFQPMEAMTEVARATRCGHDRRIGVVSSRDELGELARQFDRMLDELQERNQQIQHAAEVLEAKVAERTRALRGKNQRLEKTIALLRQTRRRLVTAEKLAAVGELTAGIAHEINNPIAVMLGNMDVLLDELGEHSRPLKTEIDLIIEQIYRIRAIVDKLLQYSRPSEYVGYVEQVDVNRLMEDTLVLVGHELDAKGARLERRLSAATPIHINRQELQQVLVNLLVNAAHAVDRGGRVVIETEDLHGAGVIIRVSDNGVGIPPEQLGKVFDPFHTTKATGIGLGLSVSYGLIRRYGGDITVHSERGRGSRFEVMLRRHPQKVEDDEALMEYYMRAMERRKMG